VGVKEAGHVIEDQEAKIDEAEIDLEKNVAVQRIKNSNHHPPHQINLRSKKSRMSQWRIKNQPMMWFQPKLNQKITAAKKSCQIPLLTSKKRPRKSPMTKKLQNRQKKNLVAHEADHEIVRDQDLVKGVLARKIQIKGNIGKGKVLRIPNHQSPEAVVEVVRGQGPGHVTEIQGAEVIQGIAEIVEIVQIPEIVADETAQPQENASEENVNRNVNENAKGNVNGNNGNENVSENEKENGNVRCENGNENEKGVNVKDVNKNAKNVSEGKGNVKKENGGTEKDVKGNEKNKL